jgi:hypothetical protein
MTETATPELREPLFEMLPGEDQPILELVDTRRSFQAISYYRGLALQAAEDMGTFVAKLEVELDVTREFYGKKALAAQERADFHIKNLGNYALQQGKNKIATPYGTVFFKSTTKRIWPEDDALINFAQVEGMADSLLKTKFSPIKAEFLKYIKATGSVPEGFVEEKTEPVACVTLRNQCAMVADQEAA